MKHMERYLAATSAKNRDKKNSSNLSAADSQEAVLLENSERTDSLSRNLGKVAARTSPNRGKKNILEITSHAVIGGNRQSTSSFSRMGGDFASCDMSIYDEVTIAEETVAGTVMEEEVIEEEVVEMEEEVVEEDEDYAWDGSKHSSQRSRLSQRFPSRGLESSNSTRSDMMYEEETVASDAIDQHSERFGSAGSRMSKMSLYDEETVAEMTVAETVTEEVTVVDGNVDDFGNGDDDDDSDGHNSDLDSDDGMPEDDDEEEEEEVEGEGFTLAFRRGSGQARVSDITLDHSTWDQDMDDEFDDDEHHLPGQGEEGYCSQFKEGNFRSSLVSHAPLVKKFPAHQFGAPASNKFIPSNKFAAPPKSTGMKTSTFVPKKPSPNSTSATAMNTPPIKKFPARQFGAPATNKLIPSNKFAAPPKVTAMETSTFVPKKPKSASITSSAPRVSIMKQFAHKPLPAVTEASARKERGEKKKKKLKSFDGAGEKKELFLMWERRSVK